MYGTQKYTISELNKQCHLFPDQQQYSANFLPSHQVTGNHASHNFACEFNSIHHHDHENKSIMMIIIIIIWFVSQWYEAINSQHNSESRQ